jgi:hypothetical protein
MEPQRSATAERMLDQDAFELAVQICAAHELFSETDPDAVLYVFEPGFPFGPAVALASSVHVHTKVSDVRRLDDAVFEAADGEVERRSSGYVKYRMPGGINLIFSSFPIAEEDLVDPEVTARLPYVDHLGVDLRDTDRVRDVHAQVPEVARANHWGYRFQGGPVYGCHAEVAEKHWVYPPGGPGDWRRPTEFPLGPLTLHDDYMGCDLRPIDPQHALAGRVVRQVTTQCDTDCSCG